VCEVRVSRGEKRSWKYQIAAGFGWRQCSLTG